MVLATLLACAAGAGFLIAFIITDYKGFPFTQAKRVGYQVSDKVNEVVDALKGSSSEETEQEDTRSDRVYRVASIFTPINVKPVNLPLPQRDGYGGAATSWGEHVVVLTHEGTIYLVDTAFAAVRSSIAAPENGFSDYLKVAEGPAGEIYEFHHPHFRYNDIARYATDTEQGLVASYTRFYAKDECYRTAVSKLALPLELDSAADVVASTDDWQLLFQTEPCLPFTEQWRALEGHMAGGRIVFDGDQTVYLASGDYSWDGMYAPRTRPGADPATTPPVARDPETDYGKVIAIDVLDGAHKQLSRGHRNTQGIALDRNGQVWVVEHGMRGGDELNLVREGVDYGWPENSYGTLYSRLPIPYTLSLGRHEDYEKPRLAWLPSIATSGLARVEGFHEAWDGDLLVATLDNRQLARVRLDGSRVVFSEFIDIGSRVRHVHQRDNGQLVLWTDDYRLLFLSPVQGGLGMQYVENRLYRIGDRELALRVRNALLDCLECHALEAHDNSGAPSLARIIGEPLGSTPFTGYSEAFRNESRTWDEALLVEFLRDPTATVPGTYMPQPRVSDERVIEQIARMLSRLSTRVE